VQSFGRVVGHPEVSRRYFRVAGDTAPELGHNLNRFERLSSVFQPGGVPEDG